MKKSAFTMVEALLVVLIITILFIAMRNFFTLKERDFVRAQTCVNYLYGEIKNSFDSITSGRWFYSWNTSSIIYPDKLMFLFNSWTNSIHLVYSWRIENWVVIPWTWNVKWPYYLSWDMWYKYECLTTKSFVAISWTSLKVNLNNQLKWDITNNPFVINNSISNITWESNFFYCDKVRNCKVIWKIQIDKRTDSLKFNRCMIWQDGKNCKQWWQ